jgi:hypothetical protein
MSETRDFIDFWVENSVHAKEQQGASQDVDQLTRRCIAAAKEQGVSEAALREEIGDVAGYIRQMLASANKAEDDRQNRNR